MKYLQDATGGILPIPDDVQIFRRATIFNNFTISGDFSTDFTVPNNSETRKLLGYYSLNQSQKLIQKPFDFCLNGNKITSGLVYVRSVADTFDLFYIAGNGNWMNQITGSIRDLDLSAYNLPFDYENVYASMSATEGVIFPVMDLAYNFNKQSEYWHVRPIIGVSQDTYYDFYPCFHAKTIFESIAKNYGFLLSGNLLDDATYNSLVITPDQLKSNNYISPTQSSEFMISGIYDFQGSSSVNMVSGSASYNSAFDAIILPEDAPSGSAAITFILSTTSPRTLRFNFVAGITTIGTADFFVTTTPTEFSATITLPPLVKNTQLTLSVTVFSVGASFVIHQGRIDYALDYNYVYASGPSGIFIPDMAQIDFVKYIAQRFNCIISFDDQTQTLEFTMLDTVTRTNAVDLSDKIKRWVQIPSSGYGAFNYLRTKEASELIDFKADSLNYADGVILSDGTQEQDILNTPFSPARTAPNLNLDWLLTSVPLIVLEDSDDGVPYSSVTNSGGRAFFVTPTQAYVQDQIVRIVSTSGDYEGFAVLSGVSVPFGGVIAYADYVGTDTGTIFKQKIVYNNAGSRELIVCRGVNINQINTGSQIYGNINLKIIDNDATVYPIDQIAWAYFCKPNIGTTLDQFRVGLNYGSVEGSGSIPFSMLYHKNFTKIVRGSLLKAYMVLSQVQYMNLQFKKFVFLRTPDVTGYFLISYIGGYQDQFTEVEIDLIFMDNG